MPSAKACPRFIVFNKPVQTKLNEPYLRHRPRWVKDSYDLYYNTCLITLFQQVKYFVSDYQGKQ